MLKVPLQGPAASSQSGARPRSQSTRRLKSQTQVDFDRQSLGLSSQKPSDMVAGLDEAANRAEQLEQREQAKRRQGGRSSTNLAVHVDDRGVRWERWVRLSLAGGAAIVLGLAALLIYRYTHPPIIPRVAAETTRQRMHELSQHLQLMKQFEEGEPATVATVKERLVQHIDDELKQIQLQITKDNSAGRPPDMASVGNRDNLEALQSLKDGWGNPFEFTMSDSDNVKISVTSKAAADTLEAVVVRIRAASAAD